MKNNLSTGAYSGGFVTGNIPSNFGQQLSRFKSAMEHLVEQTLDILPFQFVKADKTITATSFKVYGACNKCKMQIENALKKDGILKADWDMDSQLLTVEYNRLGIRESKIHQLLTSAGFDTEKKKATDEAYNKRPWCCQ